MFKRKKTQNLISKVKSESSHIHLWKAEPTSQRENQTSHFKTVTLRHSEGDKTRFQQTWKVNMSNNRDEQPVGWNKEPRVKTYGQRRRWLPWLPCPPPPLLCPAPTHTITTALIFMCHICLTRSWDVFTLLWLSIWIIHQPSRTLKTFILYQLN